MRRLAIRTVKTAAQTALSGWVVFNNSWDYVASGDLWKAAAVGALLGGLSNLAELKED